MRASVRAAFVLAPLGLALCQAGQARASGLQFDPIYLHLSAQQPTTTLRLVNHGNKAMRYQVTPSAWTQSPQGEMQLSPTEEVLAFPVIFSLEVGETRVVRIGTTAQFGAVEKTYRITVDEFPAQEEAGQGPLLQVRARLILPVFLDPAAPTASARVEAAAVRGPAMDVELRSTGNSHLLLKGVRATALDEAQRPLYERTWGPGYLLAGGSLRLSTPAPKDLCAKVRAIRVEASSAPTSDAGAEPLQQIVTARGNCSR